MHRSTGFRVNLTRQQARRIDMMLDAQRFAYNWAVSRLKAEPTLTRYDLQKEFAAMRRATPWLRDVPAIYQHAALHRARTAADISNRYGNGNLKYRSRKRPNRAVECEVAPTYVDNRTASLPGLGRVSLAEEQPYRYPANWLYKARSFRLVNVSPYRDIDVWRLYITYEVADAEHRTAGMAVGIDRGITNPTVVARSDGSVICYDTAGRFRTNQHWNDRVRRRMAKTNKHSRNYREMQRRRDRRNEKNAASRDYCEWLLAKEVCEGASVICLERLDLKAMTRSGGSRKRGLNRGMRLVRHGEIIRKIMIVAERLGIRVIQVNPAGTSRDCSACRNTGERDGERFECPACGRVMNADGNAACNVMYRGTDIMVPAGEGIALGRRELGRTRNPPEWVMADPDCWRRTAAGGRESQARNRPGTSSAGKHLGRYTYVTRVYPSI